MRTSMGRVVLCCAGLLAGPPAQGSEPAPGPSAAVEFRELAPGVTLARALSGAGPRTNSLVVELRDGLLVMDPGADPEQGKHLASALARRAPEPVVLVVFSHPHAPAFGGAAAFPAAALRLASRGAGGALQDPEFDPWREAGGARAAQSEAPLPDLEVRAPTTLRGRRVEATLIPVPPAHSPGDLVLHVESAGLVYAGDLVCFEDGADVTRASLAGWIRALNALIELQPRLVVPLRGEVRSAAELRRFRDALAWLRGAVEYHYSEGVSRSEIGPRILSDPAFGQRFPLAWSRRTVLDLVERGVIEAEATRRKRESRYRRPSPGGGSSPPEDR